MSLFKMTQNACHLDLTNFRFNIFTPEETELLSVAKIENDHLVDAAGFPIPGGLYDPAMGPYDYDSGSCQTCGNSFVDCVGHMGHIKLCKPVYNRIFGRAVYSIMRMSCLSCFKLQLPDEEMEILRLQLRLNEMGYARESQELEIMKASLMVLSDEREKRIAEYEELIKKNQLNSDCSTKTTEEQRMSLVNPVILCRPKSKNCIHCRQVLSTFKYTQNRLIRSVLKAELQQTLGVDAARAADVPVLPEECRDYLRNIYKENTEMLDLLFPSLKAHNRLAHPVDICFTDIIPVTPINTRPQLKVEGGRTTKHHEQTQMYINIILENATLKLIMDQSAMFAAENTLNEKMLKAWQKLQSCVDQLWDEKMGFDRGFKGLKQIIEKKEGIIRMHMLGKRVNHAGRTVITPDPYINVDEIGIPEYFAKHLTYPVPVTEWNAEELRKYVINGPNVHPGAKFIEEGSSNKIIPAHSKTIRESMAKTLLVSNGPKIVHRHLLNGDILLLNRQPSLHRPSIMAHKVKVMRQEKTLRLHYSNCKSYNADFDGDEMNCHCPQNELARSEAYNLVNVANNFLVPKDGTPLGGLIQDHVVAGVKMTMRGRFFNREDYHQLVFVALSHIKRDLELLTPAIIKPVALWSGKQILSTIIKNISPKNKGINLRSTIKITSKMWENFEPREMLAGGTALRDNEMTETEVIIRGGDIVAGVLDKTHFGATPHGLIHCMYELYGGAVSSQLLSSFSKLFTFFLQHEGFSLGVHDILVTPKADKKRKKYLKKIEKIGVDIVAEALEVDPNISSTELAVKMEEEYNRNPHFRTILDRHYKGGLGLYVNKINKACVPDGLLCKFPENNLQLMVGSGAKGSSVNTVQISGSLGQMELEGKRPPLMISGKSLPSFNAFETSPKSGGFIVGRYMTGISPQEFFFHCMAGREGLIDTAVKTSRSGYLQRCLVKHLEGLLVHYDMTVRDSDKCVVQFMYGEDGMDTMKVPFLNSKHIAFLDANRHVIENEEVDEKLQNDYNVERKIQKHKKAIKSWSKKHGSKSSRRSYFSQFIDDQSAEVEALSKSEILDKWKLMLEDDADMKTKYKKVNVKRPDPAISLYQQDNYFGVISERLEWLINVHCKENEIKDKEKFKSLIYKKSMMSLASPGEPVGLLAAQSIGEPSTQMTLNTFHFAGRGEMNVTLGIPRLKEILMTASKQLKTPSMDIPFKAGTTPRKAEKLRLKLIRVTVADVLETVKVKTFISYAAGRVRKCVLKFNFLEHDLYHDEYCVKPKHIRSYVEKKFFKSMFKAIEKSSDSEPNIVKSKKATNANRDTEDGDEEEKDDEDGDGETEKERYQAVSGSEESGNEDDDAGAAKKKRQNDDEQDYDESDNESGDDQDDQEDSKGNEDDIIPSRMDEGGVSEVDYMNAREYVLSTYSNVREYEFDKENELWCKLTFDLPMTNKNIDFSTLLREVARTSVIHEVKGIKRAITHPKDKDLILRTDGINITEMFKYNEILDLNRLYTNDIHTVATTYGIEAATRIIVKEIQFLFAQYGITVDPRHLLLIADYMTFTGRFQPLSREGMKYSASSLQRMSFEAPIQPLQSATIFNCSDNLDSPASRIMVGKPCLGGTGLCSIIFKNTLALPKQKNN